MLAFQSGARSSQPKQVRFWRPVPFGYSNYCGARCELIEFLSARASSWIEMISSTKSILSIAFLCSLLIIDVARRGWRLSWSRRAVVGIVATFSIFHINFIFIPIIWLCSEEVKALYTAIGIPSIPTEIWLTIPTWLLAIFAAFAYDFANYWNHRLMHQPWLWPVHAIHHSDPDVNGFTAYRVHMFEALVMWVSYTLLLSWLGLPKDAIGFGAIILALHNIYVHMNVDWDHGPLRLLIASPRFHRWHHADLKGGLWKESCERLSTVRLDVRDVLHARQV